ncbi:unnamed protein product [Arctia plantaginis]|uniref:Uncharacterized protein n=1 Tax=Arctia plantaginis TaxID=874455 RepID=A0A8S0YTC2_ARCPL|nr:unnamed protein product [Arctia plantaginis]CAB3257673.1 unnamed protein product [Arctia plantaginis]
MRDSNLSLRSAPLFFCLAERPSSTMPCRSGAARRRRKKLMKLRSYKRMLEAYTASTSSGEPLDISNLQEDSEGHDSEAERERAYAFLERVSQGVADGKYDFELFFCGVLSKMVLFVLKQGASVNWDLISTLLIRNASKRNLYPFPAPKDPVVQRLERSIVLMFYTILSNPKRRHIYHWYLN